MGRIIDFDDGFTSETESVSEIVAANDVSFTPAGSLSSTDVQAAIEELDATVAAIPDPITYIGTWDASTNTPALSNSDTGKIGYLYQVNVAGSVDFGAGSVSFEVGDKVVNNGATWDKWDMTDAVSSVNGQNGAVVLTKSDLGLGNVDNTSDATKNSAVATLTNKTLTSPVINTPTTDVMTLQGQGSSPANPSSGNYKAYVKSSTGKLTILDSSGTETAVGSGGTGVNFITNGDAEAGTTGWVVYKDTAQSTPVDGTGGSGSASVTIAASSTSPLSGTKSFTIAKGASNLQGEGVSYDFTIDDANKARVQSIKFDYVVASGTFTAGTSSSDSDMTVWIYDVTNSTLIQPSSYKFLSNSSTLSDSFQAEFQTASNSTSYRLIFHVPTTSTTAYTLKIDNVQVGPNSYVFGSPVSGWTDVVNPTGTWTTNTTHTAKEMRVGPNLIVQHVVSLSGAPNAATNLVLTVPGGRQIDTSKFAGFDATNIAPFVTVNAVAVDSGGSTYHLEVAYASTTTVQVLAKLASGTYVTNSALSTTNPVSWGSGDKIYVTYMVPILGWASSVQMSDQTSTRVVAAQCTGDPASVTSGNIIILGTTNFDTHGAYNSTTGRYTVPVSGFYRVSGTVISGAVTVGFSAYVNGSLRTNIGGTVSGGYGSLSGMVFVNAGDVIDVRPTGTVDLSSGTVFNFERISGPSQIASTETVAARYTMSSGASTASTSPFNFDTKVFDTHGTVTTGVGTWKFTAQIAGLYRITTSLFFGAGQTDFRLYKNGSLYSIIGATATSSSYVGPGTGTDIVDLNSGDYIDIRPGATVTPTTGSVAGATFATTNHIAIERIGSRG